LTTKIGSHQDLLSRQSIDPIFSVFQGLTQLIEPTVTIRCRQEDLTIVENAVAPAINSYKALIKRDVEVKVDGESFLNAKRLVALSESKSNK
jgi:hypothetical protein